MTREEAEKMADEHMNGGGTLADLLLRVERQAEEQGYQRGLGEAAEACEAVMDAYDQSRDVHDGCTLTGARLCFEAIRSLMAGAGKGEP